MGKLSTIYDHKCERCPLHEKEGRTCLAGIGNIDDPGVLIVGDGPSREEAQRDSPFNDQRGKLLVQALMEAGFKLGNDGDVFATFACKCFPAGKIKVKNMKTCAKEFLMKEIEAFKPRLILPLGKNAQVAVTGNNAPISKTHGKLVDLEFDGWSTQVMSLDHPFSILSNPARLEQWQADLRRANMVYNCEGSPFWDDSKIERFTFVPIRNVSHLKEVARELVTNYKGEYLAIDIEASGLDEDMFKPDYKVYTLQFGIVDPVNKERNDTLPVYIVPLQSEQWPQCSEDKWLDKMVFLLNNLLHPRYFKIVAHNGKYDLKGLRRVGVDQVFLDRDTMVLWAAIYGEAPMSLKEIAYQLTDLGGYEAAMDEYFKEHGTYDAPPELVTTYGCLDIVVTRHLMHEHLSAGGIMNKMKDET